MKQYLMEGEPGLFMEYLQSFLAEQGYDIIPVVSEKYFQNTLYLIFRVMGLDVVAEKLVDPLRFIR